MVYKISSEKKSTRELYRNFMAHAMAPHQRRISNIESQAKSTELLIGLREALEAFKSGTIILKVRNGR